MIKPSIKDKENRKSLEPRWSLKPQIMPSKLQGRMSMLPLRKSNRQSFSTINTNLDTQFKSIQNLRNTTTPLTEQRPSLLNHTMNFSNASWNQNTRKQVIINNLVNKLDQEEQIRSIIQQKLKNNSYQNVKKNNNSNYCSRNSFYTTQFQHFSNSHYNSHLGQTLTSFQVNQSHQQTQNNPNLVHKLKKCQQQIQYFKEIVQNMSQKIRQLTNQRHVQFPQDELFLKKSQNLRGQNQRKSFSKEREMKKRVKQISTQTQWNDNIQEKCQKEEDGQFDFLDNLDRTLKILNSNKKIR